MVLMPTGYPRAAQGLSKLVPAALARQILRNSQESRALVGLRRREGPAYRQHRWTVASTDGVAGVMNDVMKGRRLPRRRLRAREPVRKDEREHGQYDGRPQNTGWAARDPVMCHAAIVSSALMR